MFCSYGCGNEGIHTLKNGKVCCSNSWNKCPVNRKKNSEKTKITNKFIVTGNDFLSQCPWCKKEGTLSSIGKHKKSCYLNPDNLKLCPICSDPIKDYKNSKTCSHSCSNTYFRSGPFNPNWKEDSYRTTCFHYWGKRCALCDEKIVVMVHHLDENRKNNSKENLVPLCPTHHCYIHWGFDFLIKEKLQKYLSERNGTSM